MEGICYKYVNVNFRSNSELNQIDMMYQNIQQNLITSVRNWERGLKNFERKQFFIVPSEEDGPAPVDILIIVDIKIKKNMYFKPICLPKYLNKESIQIWRLGWQHYNFGQDYDPLYYVVEQLLDEFQRDNNMKKVISIQEMDYITRDFGLIDDEDCYQFKF